jgi:hypothetical protein
MVNFLNWTTIFEWCMVRCGSKNGHQNDICLKEFELRAQHLLTILGSIDLYDHLMSSINKIFK